jgi:hypothetical protein
MAWTINQIQRATQQYVHLCGIFTCEKPNNCNIMRNQSQEAQLLESMI